MRRIFLCCLTVLAANSAVMQAIGQGYPGGQGGRGQNPSSMGSGHQSQPDAGDSSPAAVKPEKAAAKAYAAGTKTMVKAHELEEIVAKSPDADKRSKAAEKLDDLYGKALDQFTEVLRNKGDMYDAWNQVGYVHLRLGAYRESVDDYNHALALKPDLPDAIEHRGEAYLALDRLDDAKAAYMDLFFHDRARADGLMSAMQRWLLAHRTAAAGMRPADIDAFDHWLQERDGIAKTTASLPN